MTMEPPVFRLSLDDPNSLLLDQNVGKVEINYIQPSKSMIERMKVRIEPTNMGI